ncbi:MAG: hypothetical protein NW217_02895 [Hyphomicrobiaceae bacterium]|nr:hypothetical protein [Hyphomicrobiaceae bacterium]
MMAHVAASGEARGRVVLSLAATPRVPPLALAAAIRVAHAFGAEVEAVMIEDHRVLDAAGFPGAIALSGNGVDLGHAGLGSIEADLERAFAAARRAVELACRAAKVKAHARRVRGEPLSELASACAEMGPWNVVVLAESLRASGAEGLGRLLESVWDTTGFVMLGPLARRLDGPIIVAIEDLDRLPALLRTSERLAISGATEVVLVLIGDDAATLGWMEAEVRRTMMGERPREIRRVTAAHGAASAVIETLRRRAPGFLLARYGGLVVPADDLSAVCEGLECPLLVVR